MSKYVVLHSNSKMVFAILDKEQYRVFKKERLQEFYNVFKVTDKEAVQFRIDNDIEEYDVEAYYMDGENNRVLVSTEEENMMNEASSYYPQLIQTDIINIVKMLDDGLFNFTKKEYEVIKNYAEKLYKHILDEEFMYAKDEEEEGCYSIFDDTKLCIALVLKAYGYVGDDEDGKTD